MHHNKQSQFELFPRDSEHSSLKKTGHRFFLTSLTLSLENLVVCGVILIMFMVISFSLGVERGAKIASRKMGSPKKKTAVVKERTDEKYGIENTHLTKASILGKVSLQASQEDTAVEDQFEFSKVKREKGIQEQLYTVQVASFKKEEYAQKEAMGLKEKGYEIFVIPKGEYSIVCVGKFSEKNQARQFSAELRSQYRDCYIRSL